MNLVEGVDDVRGLTLHECYVMVGVTCITHVSPTWAVFKGCGKRNEDALA